ncbi:MAG: hypothetical protein CFE28_10875 [Alphaproteobacteria bacterium PA2]|nr:MAG: hypothetical protein CFE28_10875 [Alphaproteobacteria bacterium PA2]
MNKASNPGPEAPAACYVRRSSGLQYYSIEHQLAAIATFASEKGFVIVRTFTDDRSGLNLSGRPGLSALLGEALSGSAIFQTILVYDVSRWGRFQDLDQAAHYEFLCRKAGIAVEYCNEPFANDGSPHSNLFKQIKRSIAAEYSRDLSQRLSRAKQALAAKGFHQCGSAPYGLRRMVLDQAGRPKGILEHGESKLLTGYRTVLVQGPPDEVETIRRIFAWFVEDNLSRAEIARRLTREGISRRGDAPWSWASISTVLSNPIYAGDLVFGKTTAPLKSAKILKPANLWVRRAGVVAPIIDRAVFNQAQERPRETCRYSDRDLLDALVRLKDREGRLSQRLVAAQADLASVRTYERRFGSLQAAFKAVGARLHKRARLSASPDDVQ